MLYLLPTGSSMEGLSEHFGVLTSPARYGTAIGIKEDRPWGMDNSVFTKGFDRDKFFSHLKKCEPWFSSCLFIVCPDVVGDAHGTLALWEKWSPEFKAVGVPVAFVLQDGVTTIPDDADWLFIGGSTEFKLGPRAREITTSDGRPVHMGRVNTLGRIRYAKSIGCESVDGTCIAYGRTINLWRLIRWMQEIHEPWLVSA